MLTISTQCAFASYNADTKLLTSSIILIGDNTTIMSGADAVSVNGNVSLCDTLANLVADLNSRGVKNSDGSTIVLADVT